MLTIETLLHNGIISSKLFAGKTTFRLSEVLNKLVNTNLRVSQKMRKAKRNHETEFAVKIKIFKR